MSFRVLGCLLLLIAAEVSASPGLIDQPQTFPWTVGLGPVVQEELGGLEEGSFRVRSSLLWFNTYRQYGLEEKMSQRVDMEGVLETTSLAWSPAAGWELRAQAQAWLLGGGGMDWFLSGFHGTLFLPNQGRDLVADGGYRDYLAGAFDKTKPEAGLTQTSVSARAFAGPWSLTAWMKPPIPSPVDWGWSDRWTGGAGIGWGQDWRLFGSAWSAETGFSSGLTVVAPETVLPASPNCVLPQLGFYTTLKSPWPIRAVVQGSWTQSPLRGKGYLSQGAGLLTSGLQWQWARDWCLDLALTEEFLTWATNEVGFQVGFSWQPAES